MYTLSDEIREKFKKISFSVQQRTHNAQLGYYSNHGPSAYGIRKPMPNERQG